MNNRLGLTSLDLASLKVAIVHEWFVDYSGSERVVEQMLNLLGHRPCYLSGNGRSGRILGRLSHQLLSLVCIGCIKGHKHRFTHLALPLTHIGDFSGSG